MKQTVKMIGCLVALVVLVAPAWGKGTAGVANTLHNLSTSAGAPFGTPYMSDNVDEICVFCHTPHGGTLRGPLWNRSLPEATSFTHYNSATLSLSGLLVTASRAVNDESLLCMSCHDGSVAVDHLLNDPYTTDGLDPSVFGGNVDVQIGDLFGNPAARIGGSISDTAATGDLSDDHPISFSYQAVQSLPLYGAGGSRDGELREIGDTASPLTAMGWKGEGVRFFGTDFRVECSSCHDPHVDYDVLINPAADAAYAPFLIRPNSGSDLCLACHNK